MKRGGEEEGGSISDRRKFKKKATANFERHWISAIVVCEDPAKHSITPRSRWSK